MEKPSEIEKITLSYLFKEIAQDLERGDSAEGVQFRTSDLEIIQKHGGLSEKVFKDFFPSYTQENSAKYTSIKILNEDHLNEIKNAIVEIIGTKDNLL